MGSTDPQPLTPVVFHILFALSEGPLHGYAVMQRVSEDSGTAMGPGTVYGSLQRLTAAGWVADADLPETTDSRRGRAFAITTEGAAALRIEAARIRRLADMVSAQVFSADAEA